MYIPFIHTYVSICIHVYISKFIKINLGLLKMILEYPHSCITFQVYGTKYGGKFPFLSAKKSMYNVNKVIL